MDLEVVDLHALGDQSEGVPSILQIVQPEGCVGFLSIAVGQIDTILQLCPGGQIACVIDQLVRLAQTTGKGNIQSQISGGIEIEVRAVVGLRAVDRDLRLQTGADSQPALSGAAVAGLIRYRVGDDDSGGRGANFFLLAKKKVSR